jgi:hypothetical protein
MIALILTLLSFVAQAQVESTLDEATLNNLTLSLGGKRSITAGTNAFVCLIHY